MAMLHKITKLGLLLAYGRARDSVVLIPPLLLIFLVLGTIFLGIATPTEGGAMGALGAFIHGHGAWSPLLNLLKQALTTTTKLASFVVFILRVRPSSIVPGRGRLKWVEFPTVFPVARWAP